MGFVHHAPGGRAVAEAAVATNHPEVDDREAADLLGLAEGYEHLRSALVALSGLELLTSLSRDDPAASAGITAAVADRLDEARAALARPASSRHDGVATRARLLIGGVDTLDELARSGSGDRALAVLHAVRRTLARTAVADVGMRRFTSVSCAGYHGHSGHPAHDHHHGGGHA